MPLTHTTDLFAKALKGKYALGAFNVNNMEFIQAIVEAAEEEKAPLMLQISKGARDYAHPVYLKKLIEAAVSLSNIPIAIHLDHGDSFELCKQCIDEGFTSVMIDASHDPFEKNVEICRKVVDYAHKHNCVVEGELGMLVGAQHDDDGWRWTLDPSMRFGGFGPWRPEWSALRMAALTVPFLGFLGTIDEPMGWGARERDVRPWLPAGGRLEVLDGIGHFIHIEEPRLVADKVLEFLS